MGEFAQLCLGKTVIVEEKNEYCLDYSDLFPVNAVMDIPYYYADDVVVYKKGYKAKLGVVSQRLSILGYTLTEAKEKIKRYVNEWNKIGYSDPVITSVFLKFLVNTKLDKQDSLSFHIENKEVMEMYYSIDPRYILQILAQNTDNLNKDVTWGLEDVVEGGYVSYKTIIGSRAKNKILIATEGRTDKGILCQTLLQLFPNISDLFYFFNYSEDESINVNGCKYLYKFCKYISQMNHSYVIALFDNDVDGNVCLNKAKNIDNINNLLIIKLPDRKEFEHFEIKNPWGDNTYENINGKAVAIENFLDFSSINERPVIKLENANGQGRLLHKEKYQEAFDRAASNKILNTNKYNTEKLESLITKLVDQWINYANENINLFWD